MRRTFAKIDIGNFANEPTVAELAGIVADLGSDEIAAFLCDLAEQMRNTHGRLDRYVFKAIAEDLHELEVELCDGGGSRLLRELASNLKEHA